MLTDMVNIEILYHCSLIISVTYIDEHTQSISVNVYCEQYCKQTLRMYFKNVLYDQSVYALEFS